MILNSIISMTRNEKPILYSFNLYSKSLELLLNC